MFLSADADGVFDRENEDLAVADFAGAGGFDDGLRGGGDQGVGDNHFELDLGQEIHRVFAAASAARATAASQSSKSQGNNNRNEIRSSTKDFMA